MNENMLRFLGVQSGASAAEHSRIFGCVTAIVTNNKHEGAKAQVEEDKGYRVKVKYPWLSDTDESYWARIATTMAGPDRGSIWLPEVGDEVVVVFEHGDMRHPIVLGSLWNGEDKYPQEITVTPDDKKHKIPNADQGGDNDWRFIKSRAGHILAFCDKEGSNQVILRTNKSNEIVLDDSNGSEKIQIYDKDNDNYIEIDTTAKKIMVETKTGDIHLKAKKKIILECEDLETKSSKTTKMEAGTSYEAKAGTTMNQTASSSMTLDGGGSMTQKAGVIKIN